MIKRFINKHSHSMQTFITEAMLHYAERVDNLLSGLAPSGTIARVCQVVSARVQVMRLTAILLSLTVCLRITKATEL